PLRYPPGGLPPIRRRLTTCPTKDSPEFRKRNGGRFGILNRRFAIAGQRRDRERHRDAVIAERIELRRAELLLARHAHPIRRDFDFDSHSLEVVSGRR